MSEATTPQTGEISVKDIVLKLRAYVQFIKSRWIIILSFGILCGLLGLAYALVKKPSYIATCSFVLEDSKGSGLSSYADLASAAGLELGGGSGSVFAGDNIIALYTSRAMITKALLSKVDTSTKNGLLIDRYVNFLKLRKKWKDDGIDTLNFQGPYQNFNRKQDSLLIAITTDIDKKVLTVDKPDKKSDIINVSVKFGDELFAKAFNDSLVATVNDFYIKTKIKKTAINVAVLQKQADSVRAVLNYSIGGVASAMDAAPNANPLLTSLRVPSQRKQVDVQSSTAIYAELVKNLELSKISLRQETPLVQVIDNPIFPLTVEKAGKLKYLVVGFIIGCFAAALYLAIKKAFQNLMA